MRTEQFVHVRDAVVCSELFVLAGGGPPGGEIPAGRVRSKESMAEVAVL